MPQFGSHKCSENLEMCRKGRYNRPVMKSLKTTRTAWFADKKKRTDMNRSMRKTRYGWSIKRIWAGVLAAVLCCSMQTFATETELKKQQTETKKQLEAINKQMKEIERQRDAILEEIQALDSELVDLMLNLELLEADILRKEEELAKAQGAYEAAKAREEVQYEAMKLRIQYIYEEGNMDYLSLLLKAESFGDFLNKADFSREIQKKDKELLTAYQEIKTEVELLLLDLELEMADMEALRGEYEEAKAMTEAALQEKQAQEEDYESRLTNAKQKAREYKNQIEAQAVQIRKLEEERRKQETAGSGNSPAGNSRPGSVSGTNSNITVTGNSAKGRDIANYALQFVGNPYVYGGTSLTNGADCSGFTQSVFRHFGISLPRTSYAQRSAGRGISYGEAQAGDLICYSGHVAIYLGNGRIVHASTERTGIITGNATYKTILAVRRCY